MSFIRINRTFTVESLATLLFLAALKNLEDSRRSHGRVGGADEATVALLGCGVQGNPAV
jgi:hypothetical protein